MELTYDLSKYLFSIRITLGDWYKKEYDNQDYIDFGRVSYTENGLKVFHNKHVKNTNELEKIFEDKNLLHLFFTYDYFNQDVVDYVLKRFFSDFKIEEWLETINMTINDSDHSYVDLGLSVLWATCNIGAKEPLDIGDPFIWGEPNPNNTKIEKGYIDRQAWYEEIPQSIKVNKFSYYNDAVDIAKTRFDAAHMNWGKNWRLPRITECIELLNKCTWEEVEVEGKYGYKIIGPNGNYILIPHGYYLTSMRSASFPYVYTLFKNSIVSFVDKVACGDENAYIRPICDRVNSPLI